jgi:cell wall-associated NlpC family hydrolase
MKKNVIRAVILSGALLGANPITAFAAEPGSYIYAGANVNVRSAPDGEVIGNLPYNAQGVLLEEDEYGWYKIQSGDVIGYVASQYCGDEPFAKGYTKATVNSNGLKVRQTKDENSNVLDIVDQNASIEVTEAYDQSAWVSVVTDDNKYGYVSADYVTLNTYYPTATKTSDVANNEPVTATENTTAEEVSNTDDVVEMTPTYVEPEETYDYETQTEPTEDYSYEPEVETENTEEVYQEETSYEDEESSYEEEIPEEEESSYEEEVNEEPSYEEETNEEPTYEEEQEEVNEEPSDEEDTDTAEEPSYEEPTVSDSSTGASIAATASNYVGCSYVWGATGPDSFDCSGLVSYVFSSYGISVPRTAADQYYGGTQIDVSTAVSTPGALIFYHGLGHVAISLGDGSVVHASNSNTGVIISDAYYSTPDGAAVYF